jgi:cation diffusion facilitator CzcD-associated flavoprotein CzcO
MDLKKGSRIAVIGAGISGIAAANILKKNGFVPVVFEKHEKIGGVWATAYPEVHLLTFSAITKHRTIKEFTKSTNARNKSGLHR